MASGAGHVGSGGPVAQCPLEPERGLQLWCRKTQPVPGRLSLAPRPRAANTLRLVRRDLLKPSVRSSCQLWVCPECPRGTWLGGPRGRVRVRVPCLLDRLEEKGSCCVWVYHERQTGRALELGMGCCTGWDPCTCWHLLALPYGLGSEGAQTWPHLWGQGRRDKLRSQVAARRCVSHSCTQGGRLQGSEGDALPSCVEQLPTCCSRSRVT